VKKFEKDKLLKWWAQSYALGVRRIMVGFRDDRGRVLKTQMLETLKLPGYVTKHKGAWNARDGLRCASLVLTKLKEALAEQPAGTRVRVEYEPKKLKHRVNFIKDDSIPDFLPADARAHLMNSGALQENVSTKAATAPAPATRRSASTDAAPELSETASAMSIRARNAGSSRIEYIRSLGPAALLYMQGKDPNRSASMRGRVNDATDGGIGIDPSMWMQKAHTFLAPESAIPGDQSADELAAGKAAPASSAKVQPSSSGVRGTKRPAAEEASMEDDDDD
jgi:RAT1-interacting protein